MRIVKHWILHLFTFLTAFQLFWIVSAFDSLTSLNISSVCWTLGHLLLRSWFLVGRGARICGGGAAVHCMIKTKGRKKKNELFTAQSIHHSYLSVSAYFMILFEVLHFKNGMKKKKASLNEPGDFTWRGGAGAVFVQSWTLAVGAALGRTLTLQYANLWWALMLLASEVGVGLGERGAWQNWHWTTG